MITQHRKLGPTGVTLAELIVVLVILIGLAGVVLPVVSNARNDSSEQTTEASLVVIRDALLRQWADTKYLSLDGVSTVATEDQRFHLRWLFVSPVSGDAASEFDPDTRLGWNGPYLASFTGRYAIDTGNQFTDRYGTDGDPAILDSFTASPIVIQVVGSAAPYDVRIVSAGSDGELDVPLTVLTEDLTNDDVDDDVFVSFILR